MDSRPLTSLVIEPSYIAGKRYCISPEVPDDAADLARNDARARMLDQILDDHDAAPEADLPGSNGFYFFRLGQMTRAQQVNRLYDALLPFLTTRMEVSQEDGVTTYEVVFRAPSPATADPGILCPSRFEGGPADGDTIFTPMVEFFFVDTFSSPCAMMPAGPTDVPVVPRPARYQFRGYDVLNRQAVYRYSGEGA